MAPSVKVTYFNVRGLGEVMRMLLKYGGIEFEDVRLEFGDWPKLKPNTPFGQLPLYEEDGRVSNQSVAVARYLAKKVKLAGNNDWENLEIDSIVDTVADLRLKIGMYSFEKNAEHKERLKAPLFNETIPFYLERLDKVAKENNGHLALGKLTWADIFFVAAIDGLNFMTGIDILENRPNLRAVRDNVLAIPSIKEWFAKRPQTDL